MLHKSRQSARKSACRTLVVLLAGWSLAGHAVAQEALTIEKPSTGVCSIYAGASREGQPSELYASCAGRGVTLGRATTFETITNEDLKATVVDIALGRERRVLLLSTLPDGQPLLEDLSGQIALAAGRGPMSLLDGVELDLETFVTTGEIGVRVSPDHDGSDKIMKLNLASQLATERSRHVDTAAAD